MTGRATVPTVGGMTIALGWVLDVTLVLWAAAEVVLQFRQYRLGGRAAVTEWGSLGAIALAFAVGMVLGRLAGQALPGLALPGGRGVLLAVGLPVAWAGIAFRLWAMRTLGRYFRPVVHVQVDHEVVRTGPYRLVRHPAYTGLLVALLGLLLPSANVASIVVTFACGAAGIGYRIRVEERVLLAAMGDRYADYAATTARLVPRVW